MDFALFFIHQSVFMPFYFKVAKSLYVLQNLLHLSVLLCAATKLESQALQNVYDTEDGWILIFCIKHEKYIFKKKNK